MTLKFLRLLLIRIMFSMYILVKLLNGENYNHWRHSMEISLSQRNKLDLIKGKYPKSDAADKLASQWQRCNDLIISWLLHSLEPEIAESVMYCQSAQEIWEELELRYGKANGAKIFQLQKEIGLTTQDSLSVSAYFAKLKTMWDEYSSVVSILDCTHASGKATTNLLLKLEMLPPQHSLTCGGRCWRESHSHLQLVSHQQLSNSHSVSRVCYLS